ncbi:MAG TPA: hypothetical protein QF901_13960 [Gammaproteobacteria bacterium]|jgi:hypothetical protein|nr:hypothetical protein [Gammaproteobacteria bacterium]
MMAHFGSGDENTRTQRVGRWDVLTLGLWSILFVVGLVPDLVFYLLRDWAFVSPRTAMVNTPAVVTLAFSAYLAFFVLQRCRESGLTEVEAQGRAIQAGLLAIVAFLYLPSSGGASASGPSSHEARTILELLIGFQDINIGLLKWIVLFIGSSKLLTWCYLFTLVVRYHAIGNRAVFAAMPSFFYSARKPQRAPLAEDTVPDNPLEEPAIDPVANELTDESRRN